MSSSPPPPVPSLGSSEAEVLRIYPSATPVPCKPDFVGRVLCAKDDLDQFHFVFVDGRLEEAIFNTRWSSETSEALGRKVSYFLDAYGGVDEFDVVLDNSFGYTIERRDGAVFALYSYACDVFSVGLMRSGDIMLHDWERVDEVT